jgi:hypothetical protein
MITSGMWLVNIDRVFSRKERPLLFEFHDVVWWIYERYWPAWPRWKKGVTFCVEAFTERGSHFAHDALLGWGGGSWYCNRNVAQVCPLGSHTDTALTKSSFRGRGHHGEGSSACPGLPSACRQPKIGSEYCKHYRRNVVCVLKTIVRALVSDLTV